MKHHQGIRKATDTEVGDFTLRDRRGQSVERLNHCKQNLQLINRRFRPYQEVLRMMHRTLLTDTKKTPRTVRSRESNLNNTAKLTVSTIHDLTHTSMNEQRPTVSQPDQKHQKIERLRNPQTKETLEDIRRRREKSKNRKYSEIHIQKLRK